MPAVEGSGLEHFKTNTQVRHHKGGQRNDYEGYCDSGDDFHVLFNNNVDQSSNQYNQDGFPVDLLPVFDVLGEDFEESGCVSFWGAEERIKLIDNNKQSCSRYIADNDGSRDVFNQPREPEKGSDDHKQSHKQDHNGEGDKFLRLGEVQGKECT